MNQTTVPCTRCHARFTAMPGSTVKCPHCAAVNRVAAPEQAAAVPRKVLALGVSPHRIGLVASSMPRPASPRPGSAQTLPKPIVASPGPSVRGFLAVTMILIGILLMAVSYLYLAAPWGFPPDSESYSNPRVPFAPAIFVLGVVLVFSSAVVYELLPDRRKDQRA